MKNKSNKFRITLTGLVVLIIAIGTIFITNCTKPQIKELHQDIPRQNAKISDIDTNCNCTPPPVGVCGSRSCAKKFLGGSFSKTFSVNWNTGCTLGWTGTTVELCYNKFCKMEIKFKDLPPCLQDCLKEDVCYVLAFSCSSTATANGDDLTSSGGPVHISIVGDPIITITCNGTDYTGTLQ